MIAIRQSQLVLLFVASLLFPCRAETRFERADSNAGLEGSMDTAVLREVLERSGSVDRYFGFVEPGSYVVVAPIAPNTIDWKRLRDTAMSRACGTKATSQQAVESLRRQSGRPLQLPPPDRMARVRIAGEDPLTLYRNGGTWVSVYPGAVGAVWVAPPGYSKDRKTALVFWRRSKAVEPGQILHGVSLLTCLEDVGDGWRVKWEGVVHVS